MFRRVLSLTPDGYRQRCGSSIHDKVQDALRHSRAHAASFVSPLHKSGKMLRGSLAKLNKAEAKTVLLRKLDKNPSWFKSKPSWLADHRCRKGCDP